MLVEYRNEIYRRKERFGLSFCNKCPLNYSYSDQCYIQINPYLCSVTGKVTLSTSEIFDL